MAAARVTVESSSGGSGGDGGGANFECLATESVNLGLERQLFVQNMRTSAKIDIVELHTRRLIRADH